MWHLSDTYLAIEERLSHGHDQELAPPAGPRSPADFPEALEPPDEAQLLHVSLSANMQGDRREHLQLRAGMLLRRGALQQGTGGAPPLQITLRFSWQHFSGRNISQGRERGVQLTLPRRQD